MVYQYLVFLAYHVIMIDCGVELGDFDWRNTILNYINSFRSSVTKGNYIEYGYPKSSNMGSLIYDNIFEMIALNYSNECQYNTRSYSELRDQGNIILDKLSFNADFGIMEIKELYGYDEYFKSNLNSFNENDLNLLIQNKWINDYKYFNYNTSKCSNQTTNCDGIKTILWGNTRYIGCGLSVCPTLFFDDNTQSDNISVFLVCVFWPSMLCGKQSIFIKYINIYMC